MTIKRIENIGSADEDGEVFDQTGKSLGRAHLSVSMHRRVHDAGTHTDGDAEVKSPITRMRGQIRFEGGSGLQLHMAVATNSELTIRLDRGGKVSFRAVSTTTGEIQVTGSSE
jgi:hypothetical protein